MRVALKKHHFCLSSLQVLPLPHPPFGMQSGATRVLYVEEYEAGFPDFVIDLLVGFLFGLVWLFKAEQELDKIQSGDVNFEMQSNNRRVKITPKKEGNGEILPLLPNVEPGLSGHIVFTHITENHHAGMKLLCNSSTPESSHVAISVQAVCWKRLERRGWQSGLSQSEWFRLHKAWPVSNTKDVVLGLQCLGSKENERQCLKGKPIQTWELSLSSGEQGGSQQDGLINTTNLSSGERKVCMFTISFAVRIQVSELCCPEKGLGEIAIKVPPCFLTMLFVQFREFMYLTFIEPQFPTWHLQPHYLPFVFTSQPVRLSLLPQLFPGQCTTAIQQEKAVELGFFSHCVFNLTFSGRCQCSTSSCQAVKREIMFLAETRLQTHCHLVCPVGKALLLSCHFCLLIPGTVFLSFALVLCFNVRSEEEFLLGEFYEVASKNFTMCALELSKGSTYCAHSYFITLPPLHPARPSCLPCLEKTLGKEEETWECPAGEAGGVLLRFPLESKSPTDFILATVAEYSLEAGPASSLEPKHRELCQEQDEETKPPGCLKRCRSVAGKLEGHVCELCPPLSTMRRGSKAAAKNG
ncbi:hypothetical protein EK904_009456 [Melospiza melodia maxima]|nr:hypothetical protein EK904_009456 [Melospiza melodia maxima]